MPKLYFTSDVNLRSCSLSLTFKGRLPPEKEHTR